MKGQVTGQLPALAVKLTGIGPVFSFPDFIVR
jgi:hypothetical protein